MNGRGRRRGARSNSKLIPKISEFEKDFQRKMMGQFKDMRNEDLINDNQEQTQINLNRKLQSDHLFFQINNARPGGFVDEHEYPSD